MATQLDGRRVALLIAPLGTEEPEFVQPRQALEDAGATVEVIARGNFDPEAQTFFPLLSAKNGKPSVVTGSVDDSASWVIGLRVPAPDAAVPTPGPDEKVAD